MIVAKKRFQDVLILYITGEFDAMSLGRFADFLEARIEAGQTKVVLDMHLVTFINSAALGYLVKTATALTSKGGQLVIASPSKFVRRAFATLGLDRKLTVTESAEDAIRQIRKGVAVSTADIQSAGTDEHLAGTVNVLFLPADAEDGGRYRVGRIVNLQRDGLSFRYDLGDPDDRDGAKAVRSGLRLKLKFRQPLLAQGRYFEVVGKVDEVKHEKEGGADALWVRVTYDASSTHAEDREALARYVADLDTLRGFVRA